MRKKLKKFWAWLVLWDYCQKHRCTLTHHRPGPHGTEELLTHAICLQCEAEADARRRERDKKALERRAKLIGWLEA